MFSCTSIQSSVMVHWPERGMSILVHACWYLSLVGCWLLQLCLCVCFFIMCTTWIHSTVETRDYCEYAICKRVSIQNSKLFMKSKRFLRENEDREKDPAYVCAYFVLYVCLCGWVGNLIGRLMHVTFRFPCKKKYYISSFLWMCLEACYYIYANTNEKLARPPCS